MDLLLLIIAVIFFITLSGAGIISLLEHEKRAAGRFFVFALFLPLPYLSFAFFEFSLKFELGLLLTLLTFGPVLLFLIPMGNRKNWISPQPVRRIDERDTMFSRNNLIPGTKLFDEYYKRNPEKLVTDNNFRQKPGLLSPGSAQYNPFQFASADASFNTIEALRDEVDGPVAEDKTEVTPATITNYIKNWSIKLGAVDCGITELADYHLYSVGGREDRYGVAFTREHQYAIAFTVEMDHEMVSGAPRGSMVMESGQQYLESGKIALQVAHFIRNLGYSARAHIDGNYQVVCPLVARDAGLGEIGRMGLLMTPKLGPRVRISVVTTNLPLDTDSPLNDYSVIDFCLKCKKCADACPSKAISFTGMASIDGVERWQINQEACFTLWCELGTDCGRCISVCPYSHPDNALHNIVRFGNRNSSLFRTAAVVLDDIFYGRKPASAPLPEWMNINSPGESGGGQRKGQV